MFREQYGVEVRAVPHGIADHGYAAAYNEVMMATVNKRYGRNVFEEIAELEIAGVPYAVN